MDEELSVVKDGEDVDSAEDVGDEAGKVTVELLPVIGDTEVKVEGVPDGWYVIERLKEEELAVTDALKEELPTEVYVRKVVLDEMVEFPAEAKLALAVIS